MCSRKNTVFAKALQIKENIAAAFFARPLPPFSLRFNKLRVSRIVSDISVRCLIAWEGEGDHVINLLSSSSPDLAQCSFHSSSLCNLHDNFQWIFYRFQSISPARGHITDNTWSACFSWFCGCRWMNDKPMCYLKKWNWKLFEKLIYAQIWKK